MAIFYFCFFLDLFFYYVLTCITDISRERLIKFNRVLFLLMVGAPSVAGAAGTDFNMAAQLLSAARNGNTRLMQNLINSGADVNYVDSTGVSVVCTAVMNNDMRAVQLLQMYGADASQCDRQIKNYRVRNTSVDETGLFSGLSPTHKLVLGSVGAIGAIAGILWATDAFDSDGGGDSFTSTGSHGSGSGGSGNGGSSSLTPTFTIPYGPAMVTAGGAVSDTYNYDDELNVYSGDAFAPNFATMNTYGNYLLMMHGYSSFARGYLGQTTLRYTGTYSPVPPEVYGAAKFGGTGTAVTGGIPINVALVTANGINNHTSDIHDTTVVDSLQDKFLVWSTMNNSGVNNASNSMISSKYFNNNVVLGSDNSTLSDDDVDELSGFDYSGWGTAIHNTADDNPDNLLAKIVGGNTSGAATGDCTGFIPNGQMTIYRTGGGVDNNTNAINYYNYRALADALVKSVENPTTDAENVLAGVGRAKISVIANTDVIAPLYGTDTKTISDFLGVGSANYQSQFYTWVNNVYSNSVTTPVGISTPSQDAQSFFSRLGVTNYPLAVFSTGAVLTDSNYSGETKVATFENAAPLAFSNVRNLFMSVVAVNLPDGSTAGATNISGFTPSQKYSLSQWHNGTNYYKSRMCGTAGVGGSSIDPWCFAGAGVTDEQATAAVAGAVGAVKAAFPYLSNQNIFALLALTADGAYLGTNPENGLGWASTDDFIAYLDAMYELPPDIQARVDNENDALTYMDAFKQVFGYGLINLDRALEPGRGIYFPSNGKIVAANGNAYWRTAALSTLRGSGVFGARGATIPVAAYDVLSSSDGAMSVMRQWNTDVALGGDASHGLYLGDTLAELKTRDVDNSVTVGNFKFGFARSERAYDDNMSGLDSLSIAWNNDRFGFKSGYQHYLTDGAGRFSGLSNPVLALTSNAVSNAVELKSGRVSVSGRAFVGNITTDGLLENDPAVSNNFAAAKLGDAMGAESGLSVRGEKLSIATKVGTMHETKTVLGTAGYGFLDLGGADTRYIDSTVKYAFNDWAKLTLRGTYAWTQARDVADGVINGLSELKSNAFAAGVNLGNFDLTVSMPLALVSGAMRYSVADVALDDNGALVVNSLGERSIDLTPDVREYRLNASYRHQFGEWTDGALGFIYRVNPNNTDAFGNESIFMMKLSHRLGI